MSKPNSGNNMLKKILYYFIVGILLFQVASATVEIDTSDVFRIHNADINFSENRTFNDIYVGYDYLRVEGNISQVANPNNFTSTGQLTLSTDGSTFILYKSRELLKNPFTAVEVAAMATAAAIALYTIYRRRGRGGRIYGFMPFL